VPIALKFQGRVATGMEKGKRVRMLISRDISWPQENFHGFMRMAHVGTDS